MKFSDRQLMAIKATGTAYELRETNGFILAVSAKGKRVFYHVWKRDGKNYRMNLGTYPDTTLSDAREKHRIALSVRHHGGDPRNVAPVTLPATVATLCADYIELWAKPRKRQWETIDKRILDKEVVPVIGSIEAASLHRRQVVEMLNAIVARPAPATANQTLKILKRVFSFAVEQGAIEHNPVYAIKPPAENRKKSRTLSEEEIRVFWHAVSTAGKVSTGMRNLLKFILVTAQRPGECNGYRYGEVKDGWWIIPPERHKQHKAHAVFLSPLAVSLTRYQNTPYGFDIRAVARCVRRLIDSGALPLAPFTPHDLRRTAATHLGSMGYSNEQIARVLGHTVGGVTAAVYNRHAYREEIKGMMLAWEARLNLIVGTNCAASGGEGVPAEG